MKKVLTLVLVMVLGVTAFAQTKIQLRSADKAQCVKSDMTSLKASFSFSGIEAQDYQNERGTFSWITMPNTVIGGNEGDPQIPVINELIAVPVGATPSIRVTSYNTTDYRLEDYGIHTLVPRQPDLRKDQDPKDVPFVYNENAYQKRGLNSEPMARVSVNGTLRGVQVGQLSIEPVSYDPVNNTLRVFNDIEVEVSFNGADIRATEDLLVKTYSPYFNTLYKQLFNGRAVLDVFDEHPDLWGAPVKMLVIANRMFESCIQDWVAWKTMKGIYVDVNYTDEIGTSASAIKTFIQEKYAQDAPTFLMIMGDKDQVAPSISSASETDCVSDLYYSSADGDEFVDMFHSRFPAETVAQMTAMLNKALEYEQYTMPDPSYLSNVLLIAGEDSGWGVTVGRPTIWYATNYYYNADHGFNNVYEYSHGTYTGCYNNLNTGVGFVNYTAHGSNTSWAGPSFTVSDVNNLTNEHKYFLAMGNCCQAADWGISSTCFGEAMVRAENKGAYAYIGSCPSTYWLNDYYFGVGATNRADGTMPTMAETGMGCYDAIWDDDAYNTVNAILYVGNLAGNAAEALGYQLHISTLYYWQAYHVLGDGSIMPYRVQPTANEVSHMAILPIGMSTYEVNAVPGSYVAISKDGVLLGAALVDGSGTVQVPITPVTSGGDVTICVTAPNRIPYIQTVPAAALDGAYIAVDSFTPNITLVGEDTNLSITFKNVGTSATTGNTTVTLSSENDYVTILNETGGFGALEADATTTVTGFSFRFEPGITLGTNATFHYTAVNGNDTWEGNFSITPNQIFTVTVAANNDDFGTVSGNGEYNYGESCTVIATPTDGYMFTSWTLNGNIISTSAEYTFRVTSDIDLVANFSLGVMIGDNGSATNQYLPSYNYYNYSFTQQIYTVEEIGAPGMITSIAFFNGGAEKTRNYDFYLKSTNKSTFSGGNDWVSVTEDDKVFSGSVTMVAGDWTTITLTNPFIYDGSSNVVLVADDNTGSYTSSPHMACRVFDATSQAIRIYSDGIDYNPFAPSYSGTIENVKNQLILSKESLDGCVAAIPSNVEVGNITANAATVTWTGFSDGYNVCLGLPEITTLYDVDFSGAIPSDWNNSSSYPWTIVNGHMQSSNAGVASSTSSISIAADFATEGTVDFDAECMGEGTSTFWDKCIFSIDGNAQFTHGAELSGWNHYSFEVPAGQHTFTWSYSKDSSVDPTGDYFAVDNVVIIAGSCEWYNPVAVEGTEYTFTGLNPSTDYCVKLQGTCENASSAWSTIVSFTTLEAGTAFSTTIGAWTTDPDGDGGYYLIASPIDGEVSPEDVQGMLVNQYDLYAFSQFGDQEGHEWLNYKPNGSFNLDLGQGYLYANSEGTTLTFVGMPYEDNFYTYYLDYSAEVNMPGWNLIGNPFTLTAYVDHDLFVMNDLGTEIVAAEENELAPMQGAFVLAEDGQEEVNFYTEDRTVKSAMVALNLSQNRSIVDRAIVRFGQSRQLPKFQIFGNNSKLYIPQGNKDYAIVTSEGVGEMPVNFEAKKNGTYTLSVNVKNVELGYLHLIDNMTGADIDLLETPSYTFDATSSDYASRFRLVFATGNATNGSDFAYISDGNIIVNGEGTLQVIDMAGRVISTEQINGMARVNMNAAAGVYVLQLTNGNDVKTQKIVVK